MEEQARKPGGEHTGRYTVEAIIAAVDREFYERHPKLEGRKLNFSTDFSLTQEWNEMFRDRIFYILRGIRDSNIAEEAAKKLVALE
jgi:hypothetical protein